MTKLRELRKSKGMTMKELGAAIGKTESCISLYETGVSVPPVRVARKIANVLGCVWEELYEDDEG